MSVIDYNWDYGIEDFTLDLDFFNEKDQEDKMWQARTGLNYETLCAAIETIIFMSDKPVTLQKIKSHIDTDLPLRVVHESIARLQEEYELKHHGIRLMEVAQGYQFRTKATYSKIIQSMYKISAIQLSPTALEVLAIISYKQPISKSEIESIRGVDSSHIVRNLMDKRLVKITGRSEEMGRPSLFGTTTEFLEIFNLSDTDQLPSEHELEELATASNLASISEIKEIVLKGEKDRFKFDEFAELDNLSESISSIASDTIFTKELKTEEKRRSDEEGYIKKTAFDILEEYVAKSQIIKQNEEALNSEMVTSVVEPKSVNVLADMIHNAPVPELENEAEYSELDSNEVSPLEMADALDDAIDNLLGESEPTSEANAEYVDLNPNEINPQEMADALDDAFDNLFGESESNDDDNAEKEDSENAQIISDSMNELDEKVSEISQMAKDLDIDLEFLDKNLTE